MKCPYCGADIPQGEAFCPSCGAIASPQGVSMALTGLAAVPVQLNTMAYAAQAAPPVKGGVAMALRLLNPVTHQPDPAIPPIEVPEGTEEWRLGRKDIRHDPPIVVDSDLTPVARQDADGRYELSREHALLQLQAGEWTVADWKWLRTADEDEQEHTPARVVLERGGEAEHVTDPKELNDGDILHLGDVMFLVEIPDGGVS